MKSLMTLLLCACSMNIFGEAIIQDKAKYPILTPELSEQKKLKIRLDNGLEGLLISDPKTEQSGALLCVKVGSWSDPVEYPGLAHFCEHMLFMGNKKYPGESEYFPYITNHGGMTQAFTSPSATCFFFTVNNDAFVGALDRFSQFFKEPLFNPSSANRERQAVNQEYAKNVENDDIREYFVHKELSNPLHPHHRFMMGNALSLKDVTHEVLKKWYDEHYSANLMRVIIHSNLSIDQLKAQFIEAFKDVPNKNREVLKVDIPFNSQEFLGKFVYIEPVKDKQTLTIIWELPKKFAKMEALASEEILCHILGHEGEKSLLADLKSKDLAESLGCGTMRINDDFLELNLEIELTEKGLKDVNQVIGEVYQTINRLKEKGVPASLFNEVQKMAIIQYQYQNKQQEYKFLETSARILPDEPMETYPEATLIPQNFDPKAIQEILSSLKPEKAQYLISALPSKSGVNPDKQEQWVGARYAIKEIPAEILKDWSETPPPTEIDLPLPNAFIPQNLQPVGQTYKKPEKRIPTPTAIVSNERGTIYYAQDLLFRLPKIDSIFTIRTPAITQESPEKVVMGDLYAKFLQENLNKFSYPAKMAGLEYQIERDKNGIKIEITGYNENARLLFHEIIEIIKTFNPTEEKFNVLKESLLRSYRNFANETPLSQSMEIFRSIIYENYVVEADKAKAMKDITFQDFEKWLKTLYEKTFIEGIIYGNISLAEATKLSQEIMGTFKGSAYPKSEQVREKVLVMPKDAGPFYLEAHTKSQGNAVLLAIEYPAFSFKERASQQILMQAIQDPFFATLRTKQQTGYIVLSSDLEIERKLFNLFLVQSSTHDPRDLLARFEEFIEGYVRELGKTNLTKEQFEDIQKALKINLEESPKNIHDMAIVLREFAFKYDGDFDWMTKRIQGFDELTYPEFIQNANDFIGKKNKRRLAVLLQGVLAENDLFMYTNARNLNSLRKIGEYKGRGD